MLANQRTVARMSVTAATGVQFADDGIDAVLDEAAAPSAANR